MGLWCLGVLWLQRLQDPWLQTGWGHPHASCQHPEPLHRVLWGSMSPLVNEGLLSSRYEIPPHSWDNQQSHRAELGAGDESGGLKLILTS